jgi:hypothetical protein
VSIREALHAGVTVVASDVVEGPTGVALFPSEDVEEFCGTPWRYGPTERRPSSHEGCSWHLLL